MGGMHGFGAIEIEVRRAGVPRALGGPDVRADDRHRRRWPRSGSVRPGIEQIDPATYLSSSYYERWVLSVEAGLVATGTLSTAEIDEPGASGQPASAHADDTNPASGDPSRRRAHRTPRASGDVRTDPLLGGRLRHGQADGTDRAPSVPRYVRGVTGTVMPSAGRVATCQQRRGAGGDLHRSLRDERPLGRRRRARLAVRRSVGAISRMTDSHGHHHPAPKCAVEQRVEAIEALLVERGADHIRCGRRHRRDLRARSRPDERRPCRRAGMARPRLPGPPARRRHAVPSASSGFGGAEGEHLVVLENTADVHNVVVCTLCSCYPWPVLGLPPRWYKSFAYRSRMVSEPRAVLAEFGTSCPTMSRCASGTPARRSATWCSRCAARCATGQRGRAGRSHHAATT